ncbi:hypothetical protein TCON_0759 [Astathelohania contejeani]|uniref:Uncharacterized protein n=1 Tax=Astathelohania contejeani TaxID=164912 RepID=A0ABQ7I0T6_9MICR|nr:hypothetical protein TCON_0759 [Thelohania contejeani]
MEIRLVIKKILNNEKLGTIELTSKDKYSYNESLEEFNPSQLLYMAVPYIQAYILKDEMKEKASEYYTQYCDECEIMGLVKDSLRKTGLDDRDTKLAILAYKRTFENSTHEWEDRGWVLGLLRYFYYIAIENIRFLKAEIEFEKMERKYEEKIKEIVCIRVDERGERKKLLVDRNKPTMSLDEYADMVMKAKGMMNTIEDDIPLEEEIEPSREELIAMDELKEEKGKGNTIGRG